MCGLAAAQGAAVGASPQGRKLSSCGEADRMAIGAGVAKP
jgi:hypothetical protein